MVKFIIKRILWMIPILLGVVIVVYAISYFAPGDPVMTMLGTANYTPEKYAELSHSLGLDQPFWVQVFNYIKNIVTKFDFGVSYTNNSSISTELITRIPYSLKLGVFSILFMVILAIPIGVLSAVKQYSIGDNVATVVSMFLAGMPNFWLALVLMLLFSVRLGWIPATFSAGRWTSWILPVLSSSLTTMASTLRMTRSSILEVIRQDYVRTARAKGLSQVSVIMRHVLKNGLIPVVTVVGMHFGTIVGGSVVIETIFNIPGVGNYMLSAINNRDYPVLVGCVLVLAFSICVVNLLVDIMYAFIDPRIKAQYGFKEGRYSRKKKKGSVAEPKGGTA